MAFAPKLARTIIGGGLAFNSHSASKLVSALQNRQLHTSGPLLRKDFYEVLGVKKEADQKQIKAAYYQLAKKYHPDTNPGNKEAAKKFQEIAEAYNVLGNDDQRAKYDRNPDFMDQEANPFHGQNPEDIFAHIFRDFNMTNAPQENVSKASVTLTFNEAVTGCSRTVEAVGHVECVPCHGSGSKAGKMSTTKCPRCNGAGVEQSVLHGMFRYQATCQKCGGQGSVVKDPCSSCSGRGFVKGSKSYQVDIPAGISDGMQLRVAQDKRSRGEVLVSIRVRPSPIFRREQDDVHSNVEISLSQSVLGGQLQVPGLYGDISINLQELTQVGTLLKFSGKGMPSLYNNRKGDHYVHTKIKLPGKLTLEQKQIMSQWAATESGRIGSVNIVHIPKASVSSDNTAKPCEDDTSLLGKLKKGIFGSECPDETKGKGPSDEKK